MMPDILNQRVKTPAGEAPVVPIIILSFGAYLTWFGVHYWRSDTPWPTDPLKAVLTGKPIPVPDRSTGEHAIMGIIDHAGGAGGASAESATKPQTGPSSTMTKGQIMSLWTQNGGHADTANVAAAVALAESSGRTGITSPNPDGGTNVGLWQLDTKGVGAGHTITQLQDPTTNVRITIMGSANGSNWSHWEAYTKNRYKQYL